MRKHIDTQSIRGCRELSNRAQVQPGASAINVIPGQRRHQIAHVDQDALLCEKDRSEHRDSGKQWNGPRRQERYRARLAQALSEYQAHARSHKSERQSTDHLVGLKANDNERVDLA